MNNLQTPEDHKLNQLHSNKEHRSLLAPVQILFVLLSQQLDETTYIRSIITDVTNREMTVIKMREAPATLNHSKTQFRSMKTKIAAYQEHLNFMKIVRKITTIILFVVLIILFCIITTAFYPNTYNSSPVDYKNILIV